MKFCSMVILLLTLTQLFGCSSATKSMHKIVRTEDSKTANRLPGSKDIVFETESLEDNFKNMKPLDILEYLKSECCQNRIVAPFSVVNIWNEEDIEKLKDYLKDYSEASSVSRPTSSVHCQGEKYQSTTDREAQHLIKAYERGTYPVAQCSTFDFKYQR